MRIDPYYIKRLAKGHPKRLLWTAWARSADFYSHFLFDEYQIPWKDVKSTLPQVPEADWRDTQVQPVQAAYLLWALQAADGMEGCVVEVGSWRGVTTSYLAQATKAPVIAIDPFIGDANETNLHVFQSRTEGYQNVSLIRQPFGAAVREWKHGAVKFVFVDAAHDYANVAHDLALAHWMTSAGGIIALHDTDDAAFPGCRRAVYERLDAFGLVAHIANLVVLQVR
jgi:predicted O-methyltransferase YrrM